MVVGAALGLILYSPCRYIAAESFTLVSTSGCKTGLFQPPQIALTILSVLALGVFVNLRSMRRISISPLGVAQNQALHKQPRVWRIIPLVLALLIMVFEASTMSAEGGSEVTDLNLIIFLLAFALLLISQIISGPWLTYTITKLFSDRANSGTTLLATKKINSSI
jgi:hypothetical protein